jgi:formylglycine-generating enzyme required for sulfatase activity
VASRRPIALPWSALVIGCFSPGGDDPLPGDSGSSSSSSTNASGDPSGPADGSETSAASMNSTTADPADSSTTDAADSTTSTSECDDVSAPCPDDQYCVDSRYCDNPPDGMVAVPGGPFWMGCNDEVDSGCEDNEYPYHEVFLSAFAIDRTEVTAAAYAACVDAGACSSPHPMNPFGSECDPGSGDLPATCVDWFQARDYCEWVGAALPTEAQWEKAARGTDGRLYPWGNEPATCAHVNMAGCMMADAAIEVGSKPAGASPYGALDMAGNVFEWVADWYSASYYVESPGMDPVGPDDGTERYPRNAAFYFTEGAHRSSFRGYTFDVPTPEDGNGSVGFRCAYVP